MELLIEKNKKKSEKLEGSDLQLCLKSFPIQVLFKKICTQSAFAFSKLTIKTLEQGVKYVQS